MKNRNFSSDHFAFGAQTFVRFLVARGRDGARHAALWFAVVLAACGLGGCQSTSPSQYISPRVEGRVLDAQTQQPLAGVKVRRVVPDSEPAVDQAPMGDAALGQAPSPRTRNDGTFVLASQRDLELFRRSSWISVTLSFEHAGYQSFTTNYTLVNATQTPGGEPLVKAGDIRLVPRSKR